VAILAVLLFAFRAVSAPLGFSVRVEADNEVAVTLSGPSAELAPGVFLGSIALYGSSAKLPVAGTVVHANGRWRLPVAVRYADVPRDWADRFRPESFSYRLTGGLTGGAAPTPVREWTGDALWKNVEVDGNRELASRYLALEDVRLTQLSLLSSEGTARLSVNNPFAFDLKIAETAYTLTVDGRAVGEGGTRGMILHAAQKNVLQLPLEVDHGELISAAGKALLSGGDVAVRLTGRLVVRLKGGDLVVPLNLSGHLTDAS
jgi:LEA14-like dessication related protein